MKLKSLLFFIILVSYSFVLKAQPLTPWNAKLWVTHPLDPSISDTIYVGLTEDGVPQFQLGADVLDTSFVGTNPANIRLHSDTVQQQFNTPCVGNLNTQILAFDTTKNLFDVTFTFWVVSDTLGDTLSDSLGVFLPCWGSGGYTYSAGLHWDTTDFNFTNQEYTLASFSFLSSYGYLCAVDGYSWGGGVWPSHDIGYFAPQPIPVISESNLPFGCFSNLQATKIEMKVLFYSNDTTSIILGEKERSNKEVLVKIYPNPTLNEVTVDFEKPFSGELILFSLKGAKILTNSINNSYRTKFNLSETLPKGVYLIKIKNLKGKLISTHKVLLIDK